ncbi:hypothetical protein ANN_22098 [Periplaneta americana]|uniref:Uncharacterized protein n=1 Tax=Periplaneta americana TaxID=6978 RepID=A0ABQ8S763_PERAM|nr:hypothetical protein ANN_22098 [Periplaneta americana]
MENAKNISKKGKKRISQPTSCKCNQRKMARLKGLEYINSKGIVILTTKSGSTFRCPQIDCCGTCEELKTKLNNSHLNGNAKQTAAVHKRRANKFYSQLQSDRSATEEVLPLCFDFMQNIPLPTIPVQETYYMRQLHVNFFCIHNIKTSTAAIYLYHEDYDLHHITSIVMGSSNNIKKFTVKEVQLIDIKDFKILWPIYYTRNYISEETASRDVPRANKVSFGISSLVHFVHDSQKPGSILTYNTVNGLVRNTFHVRQPGRRIPKLPTNIA